MKRFFTIVAVMLLAISGVSAQKKKVVEQLTATVEAQKGTIEQLAATVEAQKGTIEAQQTETNGVKAENEYLKKQLAELNTKHEQLMNSYNSLAQSYQLVQCNNNDKIYQIGDYYDANGKKGIVVDVWNGGHNGKIISLERSRQQWCTETMANQRHRTGATSRTDGSLNTAFILSRPDKHEFPAFMWCESLGEGWYLPAIEEIYDISRKIAIIGPAFRKYDKNYDSETYILEDFWSSTDCSAHWEYAPLTDDAYMEADYEEYGGPYSDNAEWMYIQEELDPIGWERPYKTREAGVRAMAYF